jgi:hypothetical protein
VYAGSNIISIEEFGSIDITAKDKEGTYKITLLDVAYVPSLHISLVSLRKFKQKKVYFNGEKDEMVKNGETFCHLGDHYKQWTFEYNKPSNKPLIDVDEEVQDTAFATKATSAKPQTAETASASAWHLKLGHAGPEAIAHLSEAMIEAKVDEKGPSTTECETCAVSKAYKIVSRRPTPPTEKPYKRIHWDLIKMTAAYNGNWYISHIMCDWTAMNHLYTQQTKTQSLQTLKQFVKYVATRYECTVRFVHLDRETTLLSNFEEWADIKGITIERSPPYTAEQNSAAE